MALLPVPEGGNQNRGGSLMAMFWTEIPIAFIMVSMRMYSRFKINATGIVSYLFRPQNFELQALSQDDLYLIPKEKC